MNINSIEIKTFYHIELTPDDIFAALCGTYAFYFDKFIEEELKKAHVSDLDLLANDPASLKTIAQHLFGASNSNVYQGLASHFGFDGWHNAGFYNHSKNVYVMEVYNNGADHIGMVK